MLTMLLLKKIQFRLTYDSINFAARAWENVTANTIISFYSSTTVIMWGMSINIKIDKNFQRGLFLLFNAFVDDKPFKTL